MFAAVLDCCAAAAAALLDRRAIAQVIAKAKSYMVGLTQVT